MRNRPRNKRKTGTSSGVHDVKAINVIVCAVCGNGDGKYKCPKCRAPFCCVQCSKDHKANHCPFTSAAATEDNAETTSKDATDEANNNNATTEGEQSKYLPGKAIQSAKPTRKRRRHNVDNDNDDDSFDDEPGWNITPEMKKLIMQSSWLRKELQDGGLRHLIETIDAASDSEEEEEDDTAKNEKDDNKNSNGQGYRKQTKFKTNSHNSNKNKNNMPSISPRELELARTKYSHPKFASFIDKLLLSAGVLMPAEDEGDQQRDLATILNDIMHGKGSGAAAGGPSYRNRLVLAPVPRRMGNGDICEDENDKDESSEEDGSSESGEEDDSEESSDESGEEDEEEGDGNDDADEDGD